MMYIRNRFDRSGNIIKNPETYVPQRAEELIEFLNEVYAVDNRKSHPKQN